MKTVTPELMEKFERVANDTGLAQKLIIKGKALGVTEGRALGVTEAKIEAARSLLDLLTDKVIAERLELPLETVVALHKQ